MQILGVKVDQVSMDESISVVEGWLNDSGKHYITTPNLEFIKAAQQDLEFKNILNQSDLAIPDSSRLGWLKDLIAEKSFPKRLLIFLQFLTPKNGNLTPIKSGLIHFDTVAGVDLMERLCKRCSEKGFVVGLLGGGPGVAEKTAERLQKKYPGIKIRVVASTDESLRVLSASSPIVHPRRFAPAASRWGAPLAATPRDGPSFQIPKLDILFVALGAPKQEKWIAANLDKIPVKVAMGVGGSFDYLSGNIPRAPKWLRSLSFEWLFRLLVQPWRIKRQLKLAGFLIGQLFSTHSQTSY